MRNIKNLCVDADTSIFEVLKVVDEGKYGIALVINEHAKLLGIVTDVDVRKALLKSTSLNECVEKIMVKQPCIAYINEPKEDILEKMQQAVLRQIPVVDDDGTLVGLEVINDFYRKGTKRNKVVIMAGGLGKRLMPFTKDKPKPLLPVGDQPILETILLHFKHYGFENIFIILNHFSEQIKTHLDADPKGLNIRYIQEEKRMGTCGALSLLPKNEFDEPFFLMNGDLLTNLNLAHLLDFHSNMNTIATACVKDHSIQVEYGVVETNGYFIEKVIEKPAYTFFVNAGIYALNQEVFQYIPKTFFDMTDLMQKMVENGEKVSCFPIHEFWMDIGRKEDYDKAHIEFRKNFKKFS